MDVIFNPKFENAMFYATLAAYLMAIVLNWACIVFRSSLVEKYRNGVLIAAFAGNVATILLSLVRANALSIQLDPFRLVNPYQFVLVFVACIVLVNFGLLRREYAHMSATISLPIIGALLLYVVVIIQQPLLDLSASMIYRSWWLTGYMLTTAVADSAFAVAFGIGIAYLIKEYLSKTKKRGVLGQYLPSMEILDELGYRLVAFGFPFFSLSIILGAIWANIALGQFWSWQPKETWSIIFWLAYLAYFRVRMLHDWRGSRSAWMLVMGFTAILFTFIGISYFLPGPAINF